MPQFLDHLTDDVLPGLSDIEKRTWVNHDFDVSLLGSKCRAQPYRKGGL